jgi:hypothetical protein
MFEFTCSSCGKLVQGEDSFAGKVVLCPVCNNATATTNPVHSAQATATSTVTSDGSFRDGAPPQTFPSPREVPHVLSRYMPKVIVAAIVLIVAGLLIPAVQSLRAAAAKTQSINNLKNIGLASQTFHDVNKRLPFNGTMPAKGGDNTSGSWGFQILPFIDQAALFNRPDTGYGIHVPRSRPPQRHQHQQLLRSQSQSVVGLRHQSLAER